LPAGCTLPYAYPKFSSTESIDLVKQSADIHAFRVEAQGWMKENGVEMKDYCLSTIAITDEARVPSQFHVNLEYGLLAVSAEKHTVGTTHWSQVRLYRRGYQLIEMTPEKRSARIEWMPAVGVVAQEKAVDDLLWPPSDERVPQTLQRDKDKPWPGSLVGPGSLSSKHREALLFAAAEYERLLLVWGPKADAAAKERLQRKAQELRERAAQ
jgi:hypothetical protein